MSDAEHEQDAPSTATTTTQRQEMLLELLRDHDVDCPVCSYNLRALTSPVCPECRQPLELTVGAPHVRLGWLLVALAPGFFSGVAACLVLILTVAIYLEDGVVVPPLAGAVLFGWASGLFAIFLAVNRNRLITRSRTQQRWFALAIWLVHVAAFVLLVLALDAYV